MAVYSGYFARGEDPPFNIDPRYDYCCVRGETIISPEGSAWCRQKQADGMKIIPHLAICYTVDAYSGEPHDEIHEMLGTEGFILNSAGQRVMVDTPWKMIDMRKTKPYGPQLSKIMAKHLVKHCKLNDYIPYGFFLDFMWDDINWLVGLGGNVDADWKAGMDTFLAGLKFRLMFYGGHKWKNVKLFLNGFHKNTTVDSFAYESFPLIQWGSERSHTRTIFGSYGLGEMKNVYKEPVLILPHGGANVAYDVPEDTVIDCASIGGQFLNQCVVFDNSGFINDLIELMPKQ